MSHKATDTPGLIIASYIITSVSGNYLANFFQKKGTKQFIAWAYRQVNKRYNLIDSGGLDRGEFIREWRIRLNVSKQELINLGTEIY